MSKAGKPFDPYNFSEIEKIQSDIERDLLQDSIHEPAFPEAAFHETAHLQHSHLEHSHLEHSNQGTTSPEDVHQDTTLPETIYTETIYTETIKEETTKAEMVANDIFISDEKKPFYMRFIPYRRLIVTLIIICTLGTGTLGMGIGIGIALWQQRSGYASSISGQIIGYNLQEETDAPPVIGSSRFIFENNSAGPVQEGTLADVVRLVDPAVVRVIPEFGNQPPLPFILGEGPRNSDGSGIIFSTDAERVYIVTSSSVTARASDVNIIVMDQDPIPAQLVGRNDIAGLVVMSIYQADLRRAGIRDVAVASFGDSSEMQVGDVVLAIGNAMGEGNSTTSGIISAGEKEIFDGRRTQRVLQTDAAINPGTSGGPLVNKQGQVIGINIFTGPGEHYAIEGMGFSIPSSVAMPIIEEIMNQTPRPWLGIEGADIDELLAAQLGIPPIGVYVAEVLEGTGAQAGGVRRGDVITSFNGRAVFNFEQLREEIVRTEVGDTVEVMIIRQDREHREHLVLYVTLGENTLNNF